jgi:hypothetical protein
VVAAGGLLWIGGHRAGGQHPRLFGPALGQQHARQRRPRMRVGGVVGQGALEVLRGIVHAVVHKGDSPEETGGRRGREAGEPLRGLACQVELAPGELALGALAQCVDSSGVHVHEVRPRPA